MIQGYRKHVEHWTWKQGHIGGRKVDSKIRDTITEHEKIAHIAVADFVLFTTLGITLSAYMNKIH